MQRVASRLMPTPCSVCAHDRRAAIDSDVAHGVKSKRSIAIEYGLSHSALFRHIQHALRAAGIVQAMSSQGGKRKDFERPIDPLTGRPHRTPKEFANEVHAGLDKLLAGAGLAQEVSKLRARADKLASAAEASGDARTALLAIRELTRLLELQGRMVLESAQGRASDVASHPVWAELAGDIMQAVQGCDGCAARVSARIRMRLGEGGVPAC